MLVGILKKIGYIVLLSMFMPQWRECNAQIMPTDDVLEYRTQLMYNADDEAIIFDDQKKEKNSKNNKNSKQRIVSLSDRDGDGVPDTVDVCPDIPGSVKAKGCPDADDDGVPDFEDACPNVAGLPEFQGCPDSDGDGIPDNLDKCPYEKGLASNRGCPIITDTINVDESIAKVEIISPRRDVFYDYDEATKIELKSESYYIELAKSLAKEKEGELDSQKHLKINQLDSNKSNGQLLGNNKLLLDTDGDGVIDVDDKCPDEPGPKSNFGCPLTQSHKIWKVSKRDIILSSEEVKLIEDVFYNLSFSYGRSVLENNSLVLLTNFAELLNKKYSWVIILHCYTNEGDNAYRNQNLSTNRGEQIRKYLVEKGVAFKRIQVKGYGDNIAANESNPNRIEIEITR